MAYKRVLWLADVLRAAGLQVVEHDGWKSEGRPVTIGPFDPIGALLHHDASAKGPTPGEPAYILHGRPPLEPGPLAQLWVSYDGVWHVLAAGRANHAGLGDGWGKIKKDQGNSMSIGVEWDHTTGENVPVKTYESLVLGFAAIFAHTKWSIDHALCGHKEYAPIRKTDPDLNMNAFRRDVHAKVKDIKPVVPVSTLEVVDLSRLLHAIETKKRHSSEIYTVAKGLRAEGYRGFALRGRWGSGKKAAYSKWQKKLGYSGKDADGIPGFASLTRLGKKHGFKVVR